METFDLIEWQQRAREIGHPKTLFALWEDVCQRFERKQIGRYELDEMKEVIWPKLQALGGLKRSMEGKACAEPVHPVTPNSEPAPDTAEKTESEETDSSKSSSQDTTSDG